MIEDAVDAALSLTVGGGGAGCVGGGGIESGLIDGTRGDTVFAEVGSSARPPTTRRNCVGAAELDDALPIPVLPLPSAKVGIATPLFKANAAGL